MPGDTVLLDLPYPIPDDNVDVPRDIKALADTLDPLVAAVVPAGCMMMWPGPVAPNGWALMKPNVTVPSATNPKLAALFGQTGGLVTIPDMTDLFPVGVGTVPLGQIAGEPRVTITVAQMPNHSHGVTDPTHNHGCNNAGVHNHGLIITGSAIVAPQYVFAVAGGILTSQIDSYPGAAVDAPRSTASGWHGETGVHSHTGGTTNDGNHAHGLTASGTGVSVNANGGDASHENRPPCRAVNYIIKLG
jgi:microcystin-dependent protein